LGINVRIAPALKKENAKQRMKPTDKIYVAGHSGLVGSAVVRLLKTRGFGNLITRSRSEVDLRDERAVRDLFKDEKPELVILAAARVGGIKANIDAPVEFLIENLRIQNNVIRAAHEAGARKLLFLEAHAFIPNSLPSRFRRVRFLADHSNRLTKPMPLRKIAGIKLCQAFAHEYGANFISVMPTNLYGPGDDFDLETSHVLAALLRKAHEAKKERGRGR
jgi:Nucleoside-diphosphate-sugar epimerases